MIDIRPAGIAAILLACFAAPARDAPPPGAASADPSEICLLQARRAGERHGVPVPVMVAVALTETGRTGPDGFRPWPWTLNVAGRGYWMASRAEAFAMVRDLTGRGARNFDLGCFQVNFRWHGFAFPSAEAMLDPAANADYAARLLRANFEETGDWSRAAGAYHSRTRDLAESYRARFDRLLAMSRALTPEAPPSTPAAPRLAVIAPIPFPLLEVRDVPGASLFPAALAPRAGLIDLGAQKGSLWRD